MEVERKFYTLLLITCEDWPMQSIPEPVGTGQISVRAAAPAKHQLYICAPGTFICN